ncbi:hypothetical protein Dsin_010856 [Dipteronia sinensis]|uniref:Uncharacterized protein n=1 Tax=Dipteronia sinensis TaxID=43782 RepID=A0AAE0AT97_9ROSI|nr:hypothetical protein Dsin_010856 [Dipteronia sinensis]
MFEYREHIVWGDKDIKMKLLRKGILTRIYSPMVDNRSKEHQATARRVLNIEAIESHHEAAVPPLFPPGVNDDDHLLIEA